MLRMRVNGEAFKRLRTIPEAFRLSDADRSGPLLVELDAEHVRQVKRAFASEGATVATGPWPPWSKKYAAWRMKHRGRLGGRMMVLRGTLLGKATSPSHGDHIAEWRGRFRYAFGFVDDAGFYQQEGAGPLPIRSVIDKTASDYQAFARIVKEFWIKRIRQVTRHL